MNWKLIIQRYKTNHRPRKEIEFDWFRQQPSFQDAVINASSARNERGKRYLVKRGLLANVLRRQEIFFFKNATNQKAAALFTSFGCMSEEY